MHDLADRIRTLKALTQQQRRILELLCERMTYRQIAAALGRSVTAEHVERQVAQILTKLGITEQPGRSVHDGVRAYEPVLQFLDDHRKPPPGMTNAEIEEIQHAPDDGRDQAPPRWAMLLARKYGEELESGRHLPSVQTATTGSGTSADSSTRGLEQRRQNELTPWQPPSTTPGGTVGLPSQRPRQAAYTPLLLGALAIGVIAILGIALVMSWSRQAAPPPVVLVTATPAPVASAPPPTQAPAPTAAPPTAAPPTAAPPTQPPAPTVPPTPTRRIQQVNQPMKIAATRSSGENPETVQYLANVPFLVEIIEIPDDSTMIWQFSVQNKNGSGSFMLSQPNAPRPYVLSSQGQKYDATSGYKDVDDLVAGEKRTFVLSFKAPTKGMSYKVAIETVVSKDRNPNFWNFYLWESPQISLP